MGPSPAVRDSPAVLWNHHTLILQVSGQFTLETSVQNISMSGGEMLLIGRNQLAAFKRDFLKTFGAPPRHWMQDKRLTEAKYLIETKHHKPSAIYLDLGFESLSHFSYSFKKKFGLSPTALHSGISPN